LKNCTFKIQLIIICFSVSNISFGQEGSSKINKLIESSKAKELSYIKKKEIIDQAFYLAEKSKNDKDISKYFLEISTRYNSINDTLFFRKSINYAKHYSNQNKDSVTLARTYWKLGNFLVKNKKSDSAYLYYYNAKQHYDRLQMITESASMQLNMAIVQRNGKDYTGSEITTTKAIEIKKKKE